MSYDENGLGFMELTYLSFYKPLWFSVVSFLIGINMSQIALKLARYVLSGTN